MTFRKSGQAYQKIDQTNVVLWVCRSMPDKFADKQPISGLRGIQKEKYYIFDEGRIVAIVRKVINKTKGFVTSAAEANLLRS